MAITRKHGPIRFADYLDMMNRLAHSFNRTTGLPMEELQACAYYAFAYCRRTHDPEQSEFSTYLWRMCHNWLIDLCSITYLQQKDEGQKDENAAERVTAAGATPEQEAAFMEGVARLSEEAQAVCQLIFESPQEFMVCYSRPKVSQGLLRDKLRSMGWPHRQIQQSFREIKETLYEIQ